VPAPDRLDDARALLVLSRLLYRAGIQAAACGIQPAPDAARALVPIGQRLAAAVEAAERAAEGPDRVAALEQVVLAAEAMSSNIDGNWEGLGEVIAVATEGVRGRTPILPTPPRRPEK
jgi:hypothetical protein